MREEMTRLGGTLLGLLTVWACAFHLGPAAAQDATFFSGSDAPTPQEYVKEAGPEAKLIPFDKFKIDGRSVICGKRPVVLNSDFDSWGGAFPGFLILNTKKINGLTTPVKLYIYSHECGHQFVGADETKADLFAIRRGVKWGWLDAVGMEDICAFISTLKGDSVHPPGPQRCETMRNYYQKLIESGTTEAAAAPAPPTQRPIAQALAPQ
jgi:hypothetical protein